MTDVMEKLRIGAEGLGISLSPEQLQQFETYYQELVTWNRKMNLTAITGYENVQLRHFLDSLTVALVWHAPGTNPEARLIDVGTGAGLPGVPVKLLFPRLRLVLLEATTKKTVFLQNLKEKLGLTDTEIVAGRAEEVAHDLSYREGFDLAVSRAVAQLPALLELTLPFVAIGGSFVAQKKGDITAELASADRAIHLLGGELHRVREVNLPELSDQRQLVMIDKVSPTPSEYPRRPGIPAKRPII